MGACLGDPNPHDPCDLDVIHAVVELGVARLAVLGARVRRQRAAAGEFGRVVAQHTPKRPDKPVEVVDGFHATRGLGQQDRERSGEWLHIVLVRGLPAVAV